MPQARANGLNLEYETFGDRGAPPLVLIMGLGAQLVLWPDELCTALADAGHYVVRFDNRDVGLSTKFEEAGIPDIMQLINALMQQEPLQAPYSLDDMADDAVGLLDALGIDRAHVCGASMGGMIAQTVAIRHQPRPARVLDLARQADVAVVEAQHVVAGVGQRAAEILGP